MGIRPFELRLVDRGKGRHFSVAFPIDAEEDVNPCLRTANDIVRDFVFACDGTQSFTAGIRLTRVKFHSCSLICHAVALKIPIPADNEICQDCVRARAEMLVDRVKTAILQS